MMEGLRRFFAERLAAPPAGAAPDRRLELATCALLLEAAHSDEELDAGERATIVELVRSRFGLDAEQVEELLAAAERERGRSTGLYDFTRLLAESWSREERQGVLELVWRVIYSDGRLEAREDALAHKLARLLGLGHSELIALKLRARGDAGSGAPPAPGG